MIGWFYEIYMQSELFKHVYWLRYLTSWTIASLPVVLLGLIFLWIHLCLLFSLPPCSLSFSLYQFPLIVLLWEFQKALCLNKHNGRLNKTAVNTVCAMNLSPACSFPTDLKIFPICWNEAVIQINDFTCFPAQPAGCNDMSVQFNVNILRGPHYATSCPVCLPVFNAKSPACSHGHIKVSLSLISNQQFKSHETHYV